MSKYSSYTDEFKEALVQKVFANAGQSVKSVSEEAGIPISTLRNSTDNYKHRTGEMLLKKKQNRLKSIDKFNAVVITSSMNESEKSEYCRKQGIYPEDLEQWKQDCISGCGGELNNVGTQKNKRRAKEWKQEAKRLQKELTRKEKALAETAALLVLKKSRQNLGGARGRMIRLDERKNAVALIDEAIKNGSRSEKACELLGLTARTVQRWKKGGDVNEDQRAFRKQAPVNRLKDEERQQILKICNMAEYESLPPS